MVGVGAGSKKGSAPEEELFDSDEASVGVAGFDEFPVLVAAVVFAVALVAALVFVLVLLLLFNSVAPDPAPDPVSLKGLTSEVSESLKIDLNGFFKAEVEAEGEGDVALETDPIDEVEFEVVKLFLEEPPNN